MRNRSGVVAFVLYTLFSLALFAPIISHPTMLIFGDDIHRSYWNFRQFTVQAVKSGEIPWWNPHQFSGYPFIAAPTNSFWYPPYLIFFLASPQAAFSILIMLHIILAASAMYWLCRNVYSLTNVASFASGLMFGFSGYVGARMWAGHFEILIAVAWVPIVYGYVIRSMKSGEKKWLGFAAFSLVFQLLAGYQTIALLTLIATAITGLVMSVYHRSILPLLRLAAATLLAVLFAAFSLLPQMEFVKASTRSLQTSYQWTTKGSMEARGFLQFFYPFLYGDQRTFSGPPPNYHEQAGYIGIVGIFLVIGGVLFYGLRCTMYDVRLKNIHNWIPASLIAICFFGLWVSMGSNAPLDLQYFLWKFVPLYHSLRIPPRHLLLFTFAGSILASFLLSRIRKQMIAIFFTLIIAVDLFLTFYHFVEYDVLPDSRHDAKLVSLFTPRSGEWFRMLQNYGAWISPARDRFDFDSPMRYGAYSATGYDSTMLASYYTFIDRVNGNLGTSIENTDIQIPYIQNFSSSALDFLGVRYIQVLSQYDGIGYDSDHYKKVIDDSQNGYRVYENLQSMDQLSLVSKRATLPLSSMDYHSEVALPSTVPSIPLCENNGAVAVTSRSLTTITARTTSACSQYLVNATPLYPGWVAFVDGKEATIYPANSAFMAVIIPSGFHTVEFRYNPTTFYLGLGISIISCLVFLLFPSHWVKRTPLMEAEAASSV